MRKRIIIPLLVIGGLVVAALAVVGIFAVRTVQAAAPAAGSPVAMGYGWGMRGGYTDQDLATALGIDVTKLQAAYKTATDEALKQAVSKGLITQAQADQATANGFVLRGGEKAAWLSANGIDYNSLLANALGISVDKLTAAYQTAFTTAVDNAVKNGQLTQQQADLIKARYALANSSKFQTAMRSAFEAAVNQAVKDGLITQAQADQILNSSNGTGSFFGHGFGGFFGGRGGMGGFGGFGRHGWKNNGGAPFSPNAPTPAAPTAAPSSGL